MPNATAFAPGAPGSPPTWSSSAKDLVGCSLDASRLWFTTGFGIVNEVFSPRIDMPQIRDLRFILADDDGFWVEVKREASYRTVLPMTGILAIEIVDTHKRYELILRIVPDALYEVLLIEVSQQGDESLRPYALLAPHVGGTGHGNNAESVNWRGRRMLWAEQGPFQDVWAKQVGDWRRWHHRFDNWQHITDIETVDSGLTLHVVQVAEGDLPAGSRMDFTLFWTLIITNVAVFLLTQSSGSALVAPFALWPLDSARFIPWQLLTYAFLHGGLTHLAFNMFGLYMFGGDLERAGGLVGSSCSISSACWSRHSLSCSSPVPRASWSPR